MNKMWQCKKHGKDCKSYVAGICKDFNEKKITPNNICFENETTAFLECIEWVDEK